MDMQLNVAAVVVAALINFAVGGLWYSPLLFQKAWLNAAGITEEQARQAPMGRVFGLTAAAALVIAFNLAAFIGPKGTAFGLFAGLAAGIGWVAMSLGIVYLFEQRPLKHWLVNAGCQVVTYALMGALLGAWK